MSKEKGVLEKAKLVSDSLKELERIKLLRDALNIDNYKVCLKRSIYIDNPDKEVEEINFCKEIVLGQLNDKIALLELKLEEMFK